MKRLTISFKLFIMSLIALCFVQCQSSDIDDVIVPTEPLRKISFTVTAADAVTDSQVKTRIQMHDGIDEDPRTFTATWEVGDSLLAYDVNTNQQAYIIAQEAGKTAKFEGEISGVNDGDKIVLLSSHANVITEGGKPVEDINISGQTGTLENMFSKVSVYGSTTAHLVGEDIQIGPCTVQNKMIILRFRVVFENKDQAKLVAFSAEGAEARVYAHANMDISTGDITTKGTPQSYMRATFSEKDMKDWTPLEKTSGGKTYYYSDIYMALLPLELPANVVLNSFSRKLLVYKNEVKLSDTTTPLQSGDVQPINVNYCAGDVHVVPAVSCPGYEYSISPGFLVAEREDAESPWTYRWQTDQGEVSGATNFDGNHGIYFTWGSVDPNDILYKQSASEGGAVHAAKGYTPETFQDVAALVGDGKWRMPTKEDGEKMMADFSSDNICKNATYKNGEGKTVYGIYVGTTSQPSIEDQDLYFFYPYMGDTGIKTSGGVVLPSGRTVYGYKPYYETGLADLSANISYWLSESDDKSGWAYRFQFGGKSSTNDVGTRETTYGRVIRGVRH